MDKFSLNLPNAIIYTNEPKIEKTLINGEIAGTFTQIFSLVSDQNFTVPPFSFSYFDSDINATKTIYST